MLLPETAHRRRVYVLRCWEEPEQDPILPGALRFSLLDAHTGARRGFASFESLVAFLRATLVDEPEIPAGRPEP